MDAVRTIRRELQGRVPLIGFAGSPWTVGTYMVEGGSSRNFEHIKRMLYGAPRELHRLLDVITRCHRVVPQRADRSRGAGCHGVRHLGRFAHTVRLRASSHCATCSRSSTGLTRENEGRRVPCILFTKGGGQWLDRDGGYRLRRTRRRLDHRPCRCAPRGAGSSRAAGQPRSERAVRATGADPRAGRSRAGELRTRPLATCSTWVTAFTPK